MKNLSNEHYEVARRKAKEYYAAIGRVWCPSLSEYIVFTKVGFRHLIWKGRSARPKNEQRRRFALLRYAKRIIKNKNAYIAYRSKGHMQFWAFIEKYDSELITVIIRQFGEEEKHFFSIFKKESKTTL